MEEIPKVKIQSHRKFYPKATDKTHDRLNIKMNNIMIRVKTQ